MNSQMTLSPNAEKALEVIASRKPHVKIDDLCAELDGVIVGTPKETTAQAIPGKRVKRSPFDGPDNEDQVLAAVEELKSAGLIEHGSGAVWPVRESAIQRPLMGPQGSRPVTPTAKPPARVVQRPEKPVSPFDDEPEDVIVPQPRSSPEMPKAAPVEKRTTAVGKGSKIPAPKVPYRVPKNQNEHHYAVMYAYDIPPADRLIGIVMHSLCFAQSERDDELSPSREITAEYLAGKAGVRKVDTARNAAKKLVEAGLFVRVDDGKGGRVKRDPAGRGYGATYRPVVPDLPK